MSNEAVILPNASPEFKPVSRRTYARSQIRIPKFDLSSRCDWLRRFITDGEGKRVKKMMHETQSGSDTTVFVYSAGTLVAEYSTAPRFWNSEFGFWIAANPSPSESLDRQSKIGNPKSKIERHPGQRHLTP